MVDIIDEYREKSGFEQISHHACSYFTTASQDFLHVVRCLRKQKTIHNV